MNVCDIILNVIGVGEENAVHLSELVQLSGLSVRDTRRTIEQLRKDGAVICSNEHGYFKPADVSELSSYVRQEYSRAGSIYSRTASAGRLLKKWLEQQALENETLSEGG